MQSSPVSLLRESDVALSKSSTVHERAGRWFGLDLLRSLAILLMIQGHTVTAVLDARYHQLKSFKWHNFAHGFTAPMFLLASGIAYGVITFRRWTKHIHYSDATAKRLRRYALLLLLGYIFQFPDITISEVLRHPLSILDKALKIGPLHVIAVVLLTAELLVLATKRRARFVSVALALAMLVMLSTRYVWTERFTHRVPKFVGAWLDETQGSLFPIFPWASFIFMGIVVAHLVTQTKPPFAVRRHVGVGVLLGGLVCVVLTYGALLLGVIRIDGDLFWRTHPAFVIFRVGVVGLVLALCCGIEFLVRRKSQELPACARYAEALGQNSLSIYIIHLLVLYGTPLTPGVSTLVGNQLDVWQGVGACVLVIGITLALTWAWVKVRKTEASRSARLCVTIFLLGCFTIHGL